MTQLHLAERCTRVPSLESKVHRLALQRLYRDSTDLVYTIIFGRHFKHYINIIMMKFLRAGVPSNNVGSPSSSGATGGNGVELPGTATRGKPTRSRQKPPPLQLVDEERGNANFNNATSDGRTDTPRHRHNSARTISDCAAELPFYHAYLTEEQEEDAFKDHLHLTGSYLMRDSKSNPHAVTMSVVIDSLHLYHFQVVQTIGHFAVVGTGKQFSTLGDMIGYYSTHNIPGKLENDPVYLTYPVVRPTIEPLPVTAWTPRRPGPTTPLFSTVERPTRRIRKKSSGGGTEGHHQQLPQGSPRTQTFVRVPPASPSQPDQGQSSRHPHSALPPIQEPPMTIHEPPMREGYGSEDGEGAYSSADAVEAAAAAGARISINSRPPMPMPRPPSESAGLHEYSEADHPDLDRIKMVLELCRQSDMIHASRKKCTCGLYLEESILSQGWMMHIDNEPGKTQGRIFFLQTATNTTTWSLPQEIMDELKQDYPVKWAFVKKHMAGMKQKSSGPA